MGGIYTAGIGAKASRVLEDFGALQQASQQAESYATTAPASLSPTPQAKSASGIQVNFSKEALQRSEGALKASESKEQEDTEAAGELTEEEEQEVQELKQRDQEVRQHEQAHIAAGGQYVNGGAQFEYTQGPDGRQYATGGEVSIDISEAESPEATITKAQVVRRAALAPAEPSGQDRRVAAQAGQMETKARKELAEEKQEEIKGEDAETPGAASSGDAPETSLIDPGAVMAPDQDPVIEAPSTPTAPQSLDYSV